MIGDLLTSDVLRRNNSASATQMLSITPLPPPAPASRRLDDDPGDASRRCFVGDDDNGDATPGDDDTPSALKALSGCESREQTYASTTRCSSCSGDAHRALAAARRRSRPNLQAPDPSTVVLFRLSLTPLGHLGVVGDGAESLW
nr:unnamed protein product [Digitaria exilis]